MGCAVELDSFDEASGHVLDQKNEEEGTVLKETTEVQLAANSLLRMEGDSRGIIILCRSGSCWITQEGDPRDYYLRDEKSFATYREGLVVVQALADTDIVISPGRGEFHLRRISPLKGWLQRQWC